MKAFEYDESPVASDETSVLNFDNTLLSTLIQFAGVIRDDRRDAAKIRALLLDFIFKITPADFAVILPMDAATPDFEPIVKAKGAIRVKRAIVDRVRGGIGAPIMSPAVVCTPMRAFRTKLGVIYAGISGGRRKFVRGDLELLMGVSAVAAIAIEHAASMQVLENANVQLQKDLGVNHDLVGDSTAIAEITQVIARTAPTDSNVLIQGENGTGKELVARAMHRNSSRSDGPFVAVNCGAIAENLVESELFGHEKGAFTGAVEQKKGKFEVASGGTIFLDEVGELPLATQVKLLRVVQEREFDRVGGSKAVKVSLRIIAATNKDLALAIAEGEFRQDLYYRLNVVNVLVPPLRTRREDISILARYFLSQFASIRRVRGISAEAERMLKKHDWPGNVRELQNAIERAVVMGASDVLMPQDFPIRSLPSRKGVLKDQLQAGRRDALIDALKRSGGSCRRAATILGVSSAYVYRMVDEMKLRHLLAK